MSDGVVSVVIAAWNEEARVADAVVAARSLPGVAEVIVADDGSQDATAARAEAAGAVVLRLAHRGKGTAVAAGVERAAGSVVLLADADLGGTVAAFAPLLEPVVAGRAEMTIGRFAGSGAGGAGGVGSRGAGGFGLVLGLARWGARAFAGIGLLAPLSGQRAIAAEWLGKVRLEAGFGLEMGLDIDIPRAGGRVLEVPLAVAAGHAVTGRTLSGFAHRGRQFSAVARVLMRRVAGVRGASGGGGSEGRAAGGDHGRGGGEAGGGA